MRHGQRLPSLIIATNWTISGGLSMERVYYIYQRRETAKPWAFMVIVNAEKGRFAWMLVLYHESISSSGISAEVRSTGHLEDFSCTASELCRKEGIEFDYSDAMQIDKGILDILNDLY